MHDNEIEQLMRVRAPAPQPHVINISKRRGPTDDEFEIGLGSTKYRCYAVSKAAAKQKAVEHFKPKKKDRELVWARQVT